MGITQKPAAIVLDDEFLIATAIGNYLTDMGYDVVLAMTHEEAAVAIDARKFDIAVIDHHGPRHDPSPIRRRLSEKGVPFVVCTGAAPDEVLADLPEAIIIAKPFIDSELGEAIGRATGR